MAKKKTKVSAATIARRKKAQRIAEAQAILDQQIELERARDREDALRWRDQQKVVPAAPAVDQGPTSCASRPETKAEGLLNTACRRHSSAIHIRDRLVALKSRLGLSTPPVGSSNQAAPATCGILNEIDEKLRELAIVMEMIDEDLTEISASI